VLAKRFSEQCKGKRYRNSVALLIVFKGESTFSKFSEDPSTMSVELPSINGEENPMKKLRAAVQSK